MTSALLAELGARIQSALEPLAGPLVYRTTETFNAKAAALAPVGATTVSITNLPAGFTGVQAGDVCLTGGRRTFTAAVSAVAGTIANAPLSSALVSAIPAGMTIQVQRDTDTACSGWSEAADTAIAVGVSVVTGEVVFNILVDSLPDEPKVNAFIVDGGRSRQIKHVSQDAMGAVWRLTAVRP